MSNMLIVYYSVSNGNTRKIAEQIQQSTGADIAEIKPLSLHPEDYDVIAIGTPTWWYTMAPAVLTFLTSHNWQGKTVIPFQTHGGWPGHTIQDIQKACKGATFAHAMKIQFDSTGGAKMETAPKDVQAWIQQL